MLHYGIGGIARYQRRTRIVGANLVFAPEPCVRPYGIGGIARYQRRARTVGANLVFALEPCVRPTPAATLPDPATGVA